MFRFAPLTIAPGTPYQDPVFSMLAQGSAGASFSPRWRSSMEMPSGLRTKAICRREGAG